MFLLDVSRLLVASASAESDSDHLGDAVNAFRARIQNIKTVIEQRRIL